MRGRNLDDEINKALSDLVMFITRHVVDQAGIDVRPHPLSLLRRQLIVRTHHAGFIVQVSFDEPAVKESDPAEVTASEGGDAGEQGCRARAFRRWLRNMLLVVEGGFKSLNETGA